MTYKFVTSQSTAAPEYNTTAMSAPVLDTNSSSPTYGKYISTINVETIQNYTFYMYAENEAGTKFVTQAVFIEIYENCYIDNITMVNTLPVNPENWYSNYSMFNDTPVIYLSQIVNQRDIE